MTRSELKQKILKNQIIASDPKCKYDTFKQALSDAAVLYLMYINGIYEEDKNP